MFGVLRNLKCLRIHDCKLKKVRKGTKNGFLKNMYGVFCLHCMRHTGSQERASHHLQGLWGLLVLENLHPQVEKVGSEVKHW